MAEESQEAESAGLGPLMRRTIIWGPELRVTDQDGQLVGIDVDAIKTVRTIDGEGCEVETDAGVVTRCQEDYGVVSGALEVWEQEQRKR